MPTDQVVKVEKKADFYLGPWHWFYAIGGGLTSLAMGTLTPQLDGWLGQEPGQSMVWWTALIAVYLGAIVWGLSHAQKPDIVLWLVLQLAALPVTLAFIALQLSTIPALLVLALSTAITAISQRLLFPSAGLSNFFSLYSASLILGCFIAIARLAYS